MSEARPVTETTSAGAPEKRSARSLLASLEIDSRLLGMIAATAVVWVVFNFASDGLFLRNAGMPVYGVSGVPLDYDDIRWHGRDERIRVSAFYQGLEFIGRLVRALAGK